MLALFVGSAACAPTPEGELDSSTSLYTLVEGLDGVYFHPPLGPEPSATGSFEATLLDGITVSVESEDSAGQRSTVVTFSQATQPAVKLLAARERYWVDIPAQQYFVDPSLTYRVVARLDGAELGTSVLSARVFDVLAAMPQLMVGVHLRVEGTGAVRSASRARRSGGSGNAAALHCSSGVQDKDEAGVDCGGRDCAPCATCSDGLQNQGEGGVDCGGPCGDACPSCSDGVQNQGEAGVDCGGPCGNACPTCSDGLQNGGEAGIDCGGPCPRVCSCGWTSTRYATSQGCFSPHTAPFRALLDSCTLARHGHQYYAGGVYCSGTSCAEAIGNGNGNPVSSSVWVNGECQNIYFIGTCVCR